MLLWSFEPHELEAAAKLIEHIVAARLAGPEGRVEAQIIYALIYTRPDDDGAIGLAVLRGKLLGIARSAADQALLHLEEQGQVVLRPRDPLSGTRQVAAGIEHATRGLLERVALYPSGNPHPSAPALFRAVLVVEGGSSWLRGRRGPSAGGGASWT
ncbi:hypothetical protein, partial [Polyangium sp. 15x6]|uniref:hypothetical protein n=1 Tax=Polyangium sp. 15x6 TaxID=3042687 RepID=UPI00249B7F2E